MYHYTLGEDLLVMQVYQYLLCIVQLCKQAIKSNMPHSVDFH